MDEAEVVVVGEAELEAEAENEAEVDEPLPRGGCRNPPPGAKGSPRSVCSASEAQPVKHLTSLAYGHHGNPGRFLQPWCLI